jgi:outer membrane protein assembly factor BamB
MVRAKLLFCAVCFTNTLQSLVAADNWPQWRGPSVTGVAADGSYPTDFSADEGVAWKVELPGLGASTPAVWGDQVFVTCGIDGQDGVVCYGMDGKEQWRETLGKERKGRHANGSGSNPSPVTDGKHVVVYFKSGTVACLRPNGRVLWKTNLQEEYGKDTLWWDLGTSPVLWRDRVIIAVMHSGDSYLVALNLADGDEAWKTDRTYKTSEESDHSYATPQIVKVDGKDVIVTWGADHLTGHDPATGRLVWECGGFNPENEGNWRVIASAAIGNGMAVVPYGRGSFLAGVRLGGQGVITETNRVWEIDKNSADVPTAVVRDGNLIVLGDRGEVACIEMNSGRELWKDSLPRNRNKYYASPVLAGNKLYCAREDGVVYVCELSADGFEVIGENDMGEKIIATPAPVRNGLLVRGEKHLFRIAGDETAQASTGG